MLPGEDASNPGRVFADEHILVKEVAVNNVAPLGAGVQQLCDAGLTGAEEALELGVLA